MKINKAKLTKALNKIGIFVGKNNINPKVSLVHFKNVGNKATVFATDLNSAGRAYFETDEPDEFEFCIEYKQLQQAMKIRSKEITVEFGESAGNGREIEFYDDKTCFSWAAKDNDSLADIENATVIPDQEHFQISGKELKTAMSYGGYARDDKDTQYPFVTGVHFVSKGEAVDIHSTDRHRIAGWKKNANQEIEGMEGISMDGILSPQNIKSVDLFEDDEQLDMYITDTQIIIVSPSLEAYASKINCQFKDISGFFLQPVQCSYEVKVSDALESISIIDNGTCNWIKLSFKEEKVLVNAVSKEGCFNDEFKCKRIAGEDIEGHFDIKKIKDIFNCAKTENITIEFRVLNERITVLTYRTDDGGYGMLGQYRIG